MLGSEDAVVNVAMPDRASAMPEDHERPLARDRRKSRTTPPKSTNADLEDPVDDLQHQLDSLA